MHDGRNVLGAGREGSYHADIVIAEMLEWCLTPCPWSARRHGLLGAQIAIRHRAGRCAARWRPHFESCRRATASAIDSDTSNDGSHVVVLGSGHLNDVDLPYLLGRFRLVTLVDAVHPLEVRLACLARRSRLRCLHADLAMPSGGIAQLVAGASWTLSTCVMSQLPLHRPADGRERAEDTVFAGHLALLRHAPRALLITDVAWRWSSQEEWTGLLGDVELPAAMAKWIWDLAPPSEHGDHAAGTEQRLVHAVLAGHAC